MRIRPALILWLSLVSVFVLVASCPRLAAQNDGDLLMRLGSPPPGRPSMQIPMGQVNLENGNVHLQFPLKSYKQRNGKTVTLSLTYDSQFWQLYIAQTSSGITNTQWVAGTQDNMIPGYALVPGWRITGEPTGNLGFYSSGQQAWPTYGGGAACNNGQYPTADYMLWQNFRYIDPDGSAHPFDYSIDNSQPACGQGNTTMNLAVLDGSGYQMTVTTNATSMTAQVWDEHGTLVCTYNSSLPSTGPDEAPCFGPIEDSNGNYFSVAPGSGGTTVVDELGRTYWNYGVQCLSNCTGSSIYSATLSFGGATIQLEPISVSTNFANWNTDCPMFTGSQCPPNNNSNAAGGMEAISSITLPDGRTYQFSYDQGSSPGHYGTMTGMTLPTGGQVNFSYTVVNPPNGYFLVGDLKPSSLSEQGATWNFNWTPIQCGSGGQPTPGYSTLTLTDPPDESSVQNQSTYSYVYYQCLGDNYRLTSYVINHYAGSASGTPLRQYSYGLDQYQRVTGVKTTLDNGTYSSVAYQYGIGSLAGGRARDGCDLRPVKRIPKPAHCGPPVIDHCIRRRRRRGTNEFFLRRHAANTGDWRDPA